MSKFTMMELHAGVLRGMTDQYGNAWHFDANDGISANNHFAGFVPLEEVRSRLLGWDVIPLEVAVNVPGEGWRIETDYSAWVRNDTHQLVGRSIHTDAYVGHGPEEWISSTVEPLLGDELGIMSAGLLGGFWWVQFCAAEKVNTPEGISFLPSFILPSSLDGTTATDARPSTSVVECDNTYSADLRANEKGKRTKIKHTKNSKTGLYEYREAVIDLSGQAEAFAESISELCAEDFNDEQFRNLVSTLVPFPEDENKRGMTVAGDKRADLFKLWQNDNRVSPWRGTTFGALQAFNTWGQHEAQVRKGANRFARNISNFVSGKSVASDLKVLDTIRTLQTVA